MARNLMSSSLHWSIGVTEQITIRLRTRPNKAACDKFEYEVYLRARSKPDARTHNTETARISTSVSRSSILFLSSHACKMSLYYGRPNPQISGRVRYVFHWQSAKKPRGIQCFSRVGCQS
jgi:hypothetical protein